MQYEVEVPWLPYILWLARPAMTAFLWSEPREHCTESVDPE